MQAKEYLKPGMLSHSCNLRTLEAENCHKLEANLDFMASSGPA